MRLSEPILAELKHEAAKTRRYLELVPTKSFDWKPHQKSMSLVRLSSHVAELTGWLRDIIDAKELNFLTFQYQAPVITDNESLIKVFEDNLNLGISSLAKVEDEALYEKWTLRNGNHIIFELPRIAVIRDMVLNHILHHRGQLSVYLRLLNVKLPGLYGPSADEEQEG